MPCLAPSGRISGWISAEGLPEGGREGGGCSSFREEQPQRGGAAVGLRRGGGGPSPLRTPRLPLDGGMDDGMDDSLPAPPQPAGLTPQGWEPGAGLASPCSGCPPPSTQQVPITPG